MPRRRGARPPPHPLLLLLLAATPTVARITGGKFRIRRDDVHGNKDNEGGQIVFLGAFGYGSAGHALIRVTKGVESLRFVNRSDCEEKDTSTHTGFFVQAAENVNTARTSQRNTALYGLCIPQSADVATVPCEPAAPEFMIFMHRCDGSRNPEVDMHPPCLKGEWRGHAVLPEAGFWALFFFNCRHTDVNLEVRVQEYNLEKNGEQDFLQVGDTPLPPFFLVLFFTYLALVVLWGWRMKTNKKYVHHIHFLMAFLLVLKSGTLLFESLKYYAFQRLGTGVPVWDVFFYIFLMLKGVLLFTAILLLGTGWSFLKPFLSEKDKRILLVVLPLQVIVNIAYIAIDETTEGDASWKSWQDTLRIFDIICCCLVLLPIVWSVKSLKDAQSTDGKVARNLARLRQFRTFYIIVVAYIYFTRIIVVLIDASLHYNWTWMAPVISELGTLGFYVFTGVKFQPMHQNPYLHLEAEDYQEGGQELDREMADQVKDMRDLESGNQPYEVRGGSVGAAASKAESRPGAVGAGGGPGSPPVSVVKAVSRRDDIDL